MAAALLVPAAAARKNAGPTVVVGGLGALTHLAAPAGQPGRLYVVEQRGAIRVVEGGKLRRQPFLDIHTRVSCCGPDFELTSPSIGDLRVTSLALTTASTLEVCQTALIGNHPNTATMARPATIFSARRAVRYERAGVIG